MIKDFVKKHTTLGFRNSFRRVLEEYRINKMHFRNLEKAKKLTWDVAIQLKPVG